MKVDGIKILVSQAAIAGIGLLWFNFNQTVFYAVRDIIGKTFNEMQDSPERYPAEEPGYDEDVDEINSE